MPDQTAENYHSAYKRDIMSEINKALLQKDPEIDEIREKEVNRVKNLFRRNNFDDGFEEVGNIVCQKF